ncbi:MAG: ABC transporter permease [Planctomycetaceae bacterium]|nr:ABC transporter permease [Planctomycetaceae bacterium]
MFGSPALGRLVWKEYRQLRTLWLGCCLGTFGLMLIIAIFLIMNRSTFAEQAASLTFWIPFVYLIAGAAIQYAGETEERTAFHLIQLAPSLRVLLAGKVGFLMVSATILQIALFAFAGVLALFDRHSNPAFDLARDAGFLIGVFVLMYVHVTIWSMFWSLLVDKALVAVVIAALLFLPFEIILQLIATPWTHGSTSDWGWFLSVFVSHFVVDSILLTIVVFLAKGWLNGRPAPLSLVPIRLPRPQRRLTERTLVRTEEAPQGWQRTWHRLRWLEWQSLRTFLFWSAILAIPVVLLILVLGPGNSRNLAALTLILPWLCALLGVFAWRNEQLNHGYRQLVFRGASPLALWLNKLLCWGVLPIGVGALIATAISWMGDDVTQVLRFQDVDLKRISAHWFFAACLSFLIGFFGGSTQRRSLLGLGMAIGFGYAAFIWVMVVTYAPLPAHLFLWPLPVLFLYVSWRHLPNWWLERSGPWVWLPRAAEITLGCLALLGGGIAWRIYEIPDRSAEANEIISVYMAGAPNSSSNWVRFEELVKAIMAAPDRDAAEGPVTMDDAKRVAANQDKLRELRDLLLKDPALWRQPKRAQINDDPARLLLLMAMLEVEEGRPEASTDWIRAAFNDLRVVQAHAPLGGYFSKQVVTDFAWHLNQWARDPRVSQELRDATFDMVKRDQQQQPGIGLQPLVHDYALYRINKDAELGFWTTRFNWEWARDRRLSQLALSNQWNQLRSHPLGPPAGMASLKRVDNYHWAWRSNSPVPPEKYGLNDLTTATMYEWALTWQRLVDDARNSGR